MGIKGFVEGGIASIVAGCSTHPLDLIKVRMQLQGESQPFALQNAAVSAPSSTHIPSPTLPPAHVGPVSVGVRIFKQEGVSALFSGVSATVLRQTLYSTTRMGLRYYQAKVDRPKYPKHAFVSQDNGWSYRRSCRCHSRQSG